LSEDWTPLPSSTELPKGIFQFDASLSLEPSTPMGSIKFVVFYLHAMVLPGQTLNDLWTLDYDKIFLQKVQFLPIAFNGDVLFELLPIFLITQDPSQMQGMDTKYDGHAWCKLVTTNIKNSFGLTSRRLVAWVTCNVCKMIVETLCALHLAMKHYGAMNMLIF
jgi:hypothetical protein